MSFAPGVRAFGTRWGSLVRGPRRDGCGPATVSLDRIRGAHIKYEELYMRAYESRAMRRTSSVTSTAETGNVRIRCSRGVVRMPEGKRRSSDGRYRIIREGLGDAKTGARRAVC